MNRKWQAAAGGLICNQRGEGKNKIKVFGRPFGYAFRIETIRRLNTDLLQILTPALFMKNSLIDPFKRMIRLNVY